MDKSIKTQYDKLIVEAIKKGKECKINGDNLDIKITIHDQRLGFNNQDMQHWFASDFTPNTVDVSLLDTSSLTGASIHSQCK